MRIILVFAAILFLNSSAAAQWKKIADLGGEQEYITCAYFLDLPGPPRIGFVGTGTNLYKTTDGGTSWTRVWGKGYYSLYYVTDICFKDSLTGWFSIFGDTDACYRTTNGGNTWNEVYSAPYGAVCITYSKSNSLLFLGLVLDIDNGTVISKDLGNTWIPAIDTPGGGIVFLSDSIAIGSGAENIPCDTCNLPDTDAGIFRSIDGGYSWRFIHIPAPEGLGPGPPLAIGETGTCFAASQVELIVWRSDNYGATWRRIADLGGNGPYSTGYIKGDLSRLSIQTDSGMYVSTDSGVTWRNDGGPTYLTNFSNDDFYSAKGVTIAGMTYGAFGGAVDAGGGLWEETWPQSGVAPASSVAATVATASPNPAGESTLLSFTTPSAGSVRVEVFDVLSHKVTAGFSGTLAAGSHSVPIPLAGLAPGVYYARIQTAAVRQMVRFVKE